MNENSSITHLHFSMSCGLTSRHCLLDRPAASHYFLPVSIGYSPVRRKVKNGIINWTDILLGIQYWYWGKPGLEPVTFRTTRFEAEALTDLAMTSLTTNAICCSVQYSLWVHSVLFKKYVRGKRRQRVLKTAIKHSLINITLYYGWELTRWG